MIIGTRYIPIKGNMELFNSNAEHVDLNTPRGEEFKRMFDQGLYIATKEISVRLRVVDESLGTFNQNFETSIFKEVTQEYKPIDKNIKENTVVHKYKKLITVEDFSVNHYKLIKFININYFDCEESFLIAQLFKYLNIDYLISFINFSSDNTPVSSKELCLYNLYINSIISPVFSNYHKYCLLNKILNTYTDLKSFIKEYLIHNDINISYKMFMNILKFIAYNKDNFDNPYNAYDEIITYMKVATNQEVLFNKLKTGAIQTRSSKPVNSIHQDGWLTSLTRAFNYLGEVAEKSLVADAVDLALQLNKKVNFSWSRNKFRDINVQWSRELMRKDIEKRNPQDIYKNKELIKDAKLLSSERDVFEEGMIMHHCVYTNYWRLIESGKYVALHLDSTVNPSGITLGVQVMYDYNNKDNIISKLVFDQAFYAYDKILSTEDSQMCKDYLIDNEDNLIKILTDSFTKKSK
ncbi:MAG: hypothetical protein SO067_04750 [Bacilli bacterium]|nr:hypothetical protein [Bacilli bacterium]